MKVFKWIKNRLGHKLHHLRWSYWKGILKEHGIALLLIILLWEIIEDVGFPLLFIFLGNHVHPSFYAGAPAAWLLCLHWIAVPVMWGIYIRIHDRFKFGVKKSQHYNLIDLQEEIRKKDTCKKDSHTH